MDYAHARHAGNAGDVFKHVALIALLEAMVRDPAPLTYVETHAGDGLYPLGSAGEWGDGAMRVILSQMTQAREMASAPASSAARATSGMLVTLGESFTMSGVGAAARTASSTARSSAGRSFHA